MRSDTTLQNSIYIESFPPTFSNVVYWAKYNPNFPYPQIMAPTHRGQQANLRLRCWRNAFPRPLILFLSVDILTYGSYINDVPLYPLNVDAFIYLILPPPLYSGMENGFTSRNEMQTFWKPTSSPGVRLPFFGV